MASIGQCNNTIHTAAYFLVYVSVLENESYSRHIIDKAAYSLCVFIISLFVAHIFFINR